MKVAVIGGREFDNVNLVFQKLDKLNSMYPITAIVSGGARGADAIGKSYAEARNLEYKEFPALWHVLDHPDALIRERRGRKYDARAGFRRNRQIIDYADVVIAFWDGRSPGTKNSLEYATQVKKPMKIFYY